MSQTTSGETFAAYDDFLRALDNLGLFHMDLSLERIRTALSRLGLDRSHPPFIHVLGTNGKGSTSLLLSRLAQGHGLRCGLYTSPHFLDLRERALIQGRLTSRADWLEAANLLWPCATELGLTYFEIVTVIALRLFGRADCDLAVMEAGLGGLHDATNALTAGLTVFTAIGMDHEKIIGPTLADIARDKAGAMKPDVPAITCPQTPEVLDVLRRTADMTGTSLRLSTELVDILPRPDGSFRAAFAPELRQPDIPNLRLGLAGPHQRENARLALAAFAVHQDAQGSRLASDALLDAEGCRAALSGAHWPGRMQLVPGHPDVILDGAHNPPALRVLHQALRTVGIAPQALIFACLRDKNLDAMLPDIRRLTAGPILVPELPVPDRAWPAADLASRLGPTAEAVPDLAAALARASNHDGPVLVAGSLYLLAEFFKLRPDSLGLAETD